MTNEQRAHDITMAYVNLLIKLEQPNDNNEVNISITDKYFELYPLVLEQVNQHFENK